MLRRSFLASLGCFGLVPRAVCAASSPPFQLGCVTYNLLKDMDLETIIRTIENTHLAAVELRTGHAHGVEPSIGQEERARVRARFERSKVKLLSYGSTCEFQSPDAAERKRQVESGKAFVDLARDTGAVGVKVRPNGLPPGVPRETTIRNIAAGLHELADYGARKNIEVWMEVHGKDTQEPQTAAEILHAASHPNVGACWNSNPTDVQDGSISKSFALLQPFLRNVHINELYSSYPWRELFRLLRESGYKRYTLAEVPESKDPERFLRYYQALWLAFASA